MSIAVGMREEAAGYVFRGPWIGVLYLFNILTSVAFVGALWSGGGDFSGLLVNYCMAIGLEWFLYLGIVLSRWNDIQRKREEDRIYGEMVRVFKKLTGKKLTAELTEPKAMKVYDGRKTYIFSVGEVIEIDLEDEEGSK